MNLTWHLIRKDLQRSRWALLCWIVGLVYLFCQSRSPGVDNLRDYLHFSAILVVVVIGIGLITDIVQADHPTLENSHWRTLPVSAGRMVSVKLLLLGMIFIVAPMAAVCVRHVFDRGQALHHASEYALESLILTAIVFSLAAAAACTKNVVHCLALWLALTFGAGTLADYLNRFAPVLSPRATGRFGLDKMIVILGVSVLIALAVILNQYVRRRPAASAILLLSGAVSTALIGTFWGYFYFYHG
jgi:uncharacterized membrane protein YhaH (DUF805 family)